MGCKKLTYQNFSFLEVVHRKNATTLKKNRLYGDHLGNVRLTYADSDGDGAIDPASEIISEKNYYPFGLQQKGYNNTVSANNNSVAHKFGYNGREFEQSFNLNTFDLGARHMDPALGRFMVIDPMADFFNNVSPYAVADNNPVANIDLYGLGPSKKCGSLCRGFNTLVFGRKNLNADGTRKSRFSNGTGWDALVYNTKDGKTNRGNTEASSSPVSPQYRAGKSPIVSTSFAVLPPTELPALGVLNPRPPRVSDPKISSSQINIDIGGRNVSPNVSFDRELSFKPNRSIIENTPSNVKIIEDLVKALKEYPQLKLLVSGNTNASQRQINRANQLANPLSLLTTVGINNNIPTTIGAFQLKRAKAVRSILRKLGIDESRILPDTGQMRLPGTGGFSTTFEFVNK